MIETREKRNRKGIRAEAEIVPLFFGRNVIQRR
jgi:hypothetical protein